MQSAILETAGVELSPILQIPMIPTYAVAARHRTDNYILANVKSVDETML